MQDELTTKLPASFVKNALSLCGQRGQLWLDELPHLIAVLESKWSITAGNPFRSLSFNYVANAALPNGRSAVLKIGLPLDDVEIFGEAAYLKTLNGVGAAKLLEFDRELQAVLLERVVPGANLKLFCKKNKGQAVSISIRLLKGILRPVPPEDENFIQLDEWFDGLRRSVGTKFPRDYAEKALTYYAELSSDTSSRFLLHGDLHHENILSASREPFLVIDPKGMIGHFGYDIGVFLNNHYDWLDWDTRLEGQLDKAIGEFVIGFDMAELEVRKWAFCQMVLSWWWMFDEMPESFGDELGLSDIWKV